MQISKDLSGFTGAEADVLRKAIGKKDIKLMEKMEKKFIDGAVAGYVEVGLDDGSRAKVHRARLFKVLESPDKFTIEEVMAQGFSLGEAL